MRIKPWLPLVMFILLGLAACKTVNSGSALKADDAEGRAEAIYTQVRGMLQSKYPSELGHTWNFGTMSLEPDWIIQSPDEIWGKSGAQLPAKLDCDPGNALCDKNFLRLSCSTDSDCPTVGTRCLPFEAAVSRLDAPIPSMCLAPTDQLLNRYYRVMTAPQWELDIASLSMPDGRFLHATINALTVLLQKPRSNLSKPVRVRLFFSGAHAGKLNFFGPPASQLENWAGLIKAKLKDNGLDPLLINQLQMDLAWLSNHEITNIEQLFAKFGDFISWNHAKIVAADGKRAIVGGHNLWDGDYLSPTPIFDLSMEFSGSSVVGAVDFLDTMWRLSKKEAAFYPNSREALFSNFGQEPRDSEKGKVKTLGIGRLGVFGANPSDDALNELILSARNKVFIFQQDLYGQAKVERSKTFVMASIVKAAVRGVPVTIVQSNKGKFGGYGAVEPESTYKGVLDETVKALVASGISTSQAQRKACSTVSFAPFRFTSGVGKWPQDNITPIGTHSKLVIVDDAAFYIGSHNLYAANLQEYGNIITDAGATSQLLDQYWNKLWTQSKPSLLPCPY